MKYTPYKNRTRNFLTARSAYFIHECCSVQAFGANPASPILTICRKQPSAVADWIATAVRNKGFEAYLLRHGSGDWELYSARGKPTDRGDSLPPADERYLTTAVPVDRAAFLQEARELTGDPGISLLACSEGHAGASAADDSNVEVICSRMIGEADRADLEHVVLIDSKKWPCRVTGIFANVAMLSPRMQDVFLDRLTRLENSWPLAVRDFHDHLADRLAMRRQSYVCELLRDCGHVARMSGGRITAMVAQWLVASPRSRYQFAQYIVETLREGLIFQKNTAETFSEEIIQRRGADVVKDYTKHIIYR
jgi:hypothetical protein